MKYLPPLNYIRSFEASARHLSFTKAAEELRMTQAAVSGHVRALEQFIGRPLFYRAPRSLALTEVASAYLPALQRALAQIDVATGQVQTVRHRKEVTIACPASLATNWLPERLSAYRAENPEVEVTVHATIWAESTEQIVDLRIIPRHVSQPLVGESLGEERLVMVCRPDFLTGPDPMRVPADVLKKGLIHILGRQELWEAFARHHGIPDLPLVQGLKTDSSNVALEMAIAGLGCAVTLASLAEVHVQRGLLVEPFPGKIASGWGYDLRPGELSPTRASEKLMQFLLKQI
ncbi:LysR family transcriptional regulator [Tabrizicola sp. TH137]|uniref:LysR substrate-binding domain-containing protein n=1 Tax=Tabrizicola sp. TH137 TaxID=2067452 RepID=UPI000C7E11B7|nr:LysR substrate-binding domain-containing protein [Tabrizicola sp. TH137]PLL10311.1 LysR family transcriptional regulator [Tabrizicola sp. TH137]